MDKGNLTDRLEAVTAGERVRWAIDEYDDQLIMSTSFGLQSAVLLHMVTEIKPDIPVIFIDTQNLHYQTYRFAEELKDRLGLQNVKTYQAKRSAAMQRALDGKRWLGSDKEQEAYKWENKVEPMNRAVKELGAKCWISGVRRKQSGYREHKPVAERQAEILKLYPLIDWTRKDVHDYMVLHDLPYHPLHEEGYTTVGDFYEDPAERSECGLHAPDLVVRPGGSHI